MADQRFPAIMRQAADSVHPHRARVLQRVEWFAVLVAIAVTVIRHGLNHDGVHPNLALGVIPFLALGAATAGMLLRYQWSLARVSFRKKHLIPGLLLIGWCAGIVAIIIFGPSLDRWVSEGLDRKGAFVLWSEFIAFCLTLSGVVGAVRQSATLVNSPALLLVISFMILVSIGTLLLMLPRARVQESPDELVSAPFSVAFFTATSASCVTGLIVVPTGSYWSSFGHSIILMLFQTGGLGIMTWGALFAVLAGQRMGIREAATFRELLESDNISSVRRLLFTIFAFTICIELVGAVTLSGLWADRPFGERCFYSLFHSVSAFCNAGFSLHDDGFLGMGSRWQVWGPLTILIITGGLGFGVVYNLSAVLGSSVKTWKHRKNRAVWSPPVRARANGNEEAASLVRLSLTSRLTLSASLFLLVVGAIGFFMLESTAPEPGQSLSKRIADAWFQSVTFRTAGFNTVDHGEMQTATKFFAIPLMFIGASPGSTGGGVKTITFALLSLTIISILRGRSRIEVGHRTLDMEQVNRALAVIAIGMGIVMSVTLLLVMFERQPQRFLDHLYEATSALATVGVSTGVTSELSMPSRILIAFTMFVGRIGPLTMLIALSRADREARYSYPEERVSLG